MIAHHNPDSSAEGRWAIDRRQVLRLSAMGLAAPVTLAAPALARAASQPSPALLAVADKRFPASLAFAGAIRPHVGDVHDVAAGLTAIWRDVLVPHWAIPGSVVCGLTTPAVWNGLREQARSAGRRAFRYTAHDDHHGACGMDQEVRQLVIAAYARTAPSGAKPALSTPFEGIAPATGLRAPAAVDRLPALISWIIR
ncbi:hypothetical protein [Novosphingobium sp. MMS21-SN21R]|uniref:hypothetical protein n=1 Tax=Novosphingobium sp. MMS21-SN21R TaxID=2969298 RepID=UPI002885AB54|nr:hypothetical protein [Novosphingobium sp. MMS21-SN21R]MDT0510252.1 hypothetical protein [Novosphingobium sp. MMS21-SN21R]